MESWLSAFGGLPSADEALLSLVLVRATRLTAESRQPRARSHASIPVQAKYAIVPIAIGMPYGRSIMRGFRSVAIAAS